MKKKQPYIIIAVCAMILIILAVAGILKVSIKKKTGNEPEYVFLYAENQIADYPTTQGANRFAELVYERTDGRIKILVKPDAELGSEMQVIQQMNVGSPFRFV